MYTIQPCHSMQSHIRKVHACLAVTYHLHFGQNNRDLLRAPHGGGTDTEIRLSTESRPWIRKFSRRSCRDSPFPSPFPSRVRCSSLTTELFPPLYVRGWGEFNHKAFYECYYQRSFINSSKRYILPFQSSGAV